MKEVKHGSRLERKKFNRKLFLFKAFECKNKGFEFVIKGFEYKIRGIEYKKNKA